MTTRRSLYLPCLHFEGDGLSAREEVVGVSATRLTSTGTPRRARPPVPPDVWTVYPPTVSARRVEVVTINVGEGFLSYPLVLTKRLVTKV